MQPPGADGVGEPNLAAEQLTRDLSNELMSPYCPGRTISSCPSKNARKLEDFILDQAAAGKSRDEIEQILVAEFGREKLGTVRSPHVVWTAGAIALLAALLIGVAARRWLARGQALAASGPASGPGRGEGPGTGEVRSDVAPSEDELERLEDALADVREF